MLTIVVTTEEGFDQERQMFVQGNSYSLDLEHSLVSLSKWESFFEKPFLSETPKSRMELLWYVNSMLLTPNPPAGFLQSLSNLNITEINDYMAAKMTATWFSEEESSRRSGEMITAEIIYYWMVTMNIPFECQYWHINKLLTLIRVCNKKNAPPKKMSAREIAERNRRINEERRAQLKTSG